MEEDLTLAVNQLSEGPGRESPAEDPEQDYRSFTECGDEQAVEDFPESVLSFLQFLKQRSENAEKLILQDLDSTDTWSGECFLVQSKYEPSVHSDYFAQLASEYNEEPETFKKRVLADIEEDDRKDLLSFENTNIENMDIRKEDAEPADKLAGSDEVITLCYIEVEESCRQKVQQWEKEQEKHEELNKAALNAQKAVLEEEMKEQDKKRENWKKEFDKELLRLNTLQQQRQAQLDSDLKRNNEALEQDLKEHQNQIDKIEADLILERKAFEEQKAKAKKCLEELQCRSAVKIQAAFRARKVYKMYAPILMQKKEELKIKKELQHKMDMERKELQEKIKRKLEEKRQKDEERQQNEEVTKRRIEEAERKGILEQEMRQREYEKKKNEEKMRLEKAKLLKEHEKRKHKRNSPINYSKNESLAEEGQPKDELNVTLKMAENTIMKEEEKVESQEKHCDISQERGVRMKLNSNERNTHVETVSDQKPEEVSGASETYGDSFPSVHKEDHKDLQKSMESESPSFVLTGPPASSTEEHICIAWPTVNHMEEQDIRQIAGNLQDETQLFPVSLNSGVLSDQAEVKRLAWMKSCKPWSKILKSNQKVVVKKARQRKSSATKALPPLKEALILHNTPWQYLEQVTLLTLHDLPGCSLSTLSKCINLKFLSLRRCGLTTLDGLSNCKVLQYIDVQENCISVINCEGLKNLDVLLLNKNQITLIHGIEDCESLMNLELSFNLITKIAGLESLKNLQRLVLDHNQLISTKALETTPLLTYLDCSYNYLSELEGIQNCGLMQILKLQGNNLSEIPRLDNHVLMRELYVDDNNLTSLSDLSSCWLPLLQIFSVSQNSIIHLIAFNTFNSLEELNLSSNCLSELETVTLWLEGCMVLRKLSISKNPFLQEHNWRFTLQKTLPALRYLNDEELKSEDKNILKAPPGSFMAFCQHQISKFSKLWHVVNSEERVSSSLQKLKVYCKSLKEILQLSNVYRYAHEYGNIEVAERENPEIPRDYVSQLDLGRNQHSIQINSGSHEDDEDEWDDTKQITFQQAQPLFEHSFVNAKQPDQASRGSMKNLPWQLEISKRKDIEEHSREVAAVRIQSQWRGYVIRRDIHYYAKLHEAASIIQSTWRHYCSRKTSLHKKSANSKTSEVKQHAATAIQAAWKGFFLRKKLAAAFAGIDREELEDDFEEVNLDEFTFDDTIFEKGWSADSTLTHSEALHLFTKPERPKKYNPEEDKKCSIPWFPQEAWAGSENSTLEQRNRHKKDTNQVNKWLEKQNLSHVYSMKSNTDVSSKLEKEEKISQEWGFKEASTAQLMLKRAQKMKCKQAKHKKMLDPAVRLALFKNNENKHAPVMPPKKAQPIKIEYFRGKEEELCHLRELPSESLARSRELTYQWLHSQCADITNSSTSKRFLPELKHDILTGGRVQLVTNGPLSKEADDLDLLSVKSGSTFSQNREEKIKIGSSGTSSRSLFVPEKSNDGPQRKERISFRDNPVQFSTGWGGGKKKGKVTK